MSVLEACSVGDETRGMSLLATQPVGIALLSKRAGAPQRANVLRRRREAEVKSNLPGSHRPGFYGWFADWSGQDAPLTEDGYDTVAAMEADKEMELFIRRLIKAMNCKVIDMGGLRGVVPYYSGTKVAQSFANLERDLARGLHKHGKYGPWLAKQK